MLLISVIIPTFNSAATIKRAIDSVVAQTFKDFEIIVVDDASNDDTVQIVKEISDHRLRLIALSQHKNGNYARNRGIESARGDFIAFLDSDDEWLPKHLERMLKIIFESQSDCVYSVPLFGNSEFLPRYAARAADESMIDFLLQNPYNAQTSTLFMTRASVRDIMFDESLERHQDYDFLCRYDKKYKLFSDEVKSVVYYLSPARFDDKKLESCIRFIESNRRDIKNYDAAANYAENMLRICAENNISDKYRKYYKDMLYKFRDRFINVIEIDSRNVGLQSGIARYFNVLGAQMPENIRMKKIIFYHSVDIKEIKICDSENELQIFHPEKFQIHTLYEAVFQWLASRLEKMKNIIVKCNCLGCENFAYLIRSRFVCKTVGVLHCLPNHSLNSAKKRLINPESAIFPQSNPFKLMDHIILVCDSGKEFLQGVRNDIPFSVIYNGISAPKISVNKPNDGKFRFIFANGLGGHKGFDKIIPAIRSVAAKHDIEILVLGGGKLSDVAGKVAADLPVRFLGFIKDRAEIARYYEMADAALFASASEACSFAGIEAMAHNLPIVSTNAAGLQEMFGKAALFATMTRDELKGTFEINTDEYADHMISIIENSRLQRKLQVLGYARYLERYTARKMVRDTVKVYEQLCS